MHQNQPDPKASEQGNIMNQVGKPGVINSFAAHARMQFLKAGPFSLGAFTEIGGGPGWEGRNTFEFAIGAVASLSFRNLITVSVRMWGKVYSDSFCPSEPANDSMGESEPGWCSQLDGVADTDPVWGENGLDVPNVFEPDLMGNKHRKRMTKGRFMMSLLVEIHFVLFGEDTYTAWLEAARRAVGDQP